MVYFVVGREDIGAPWLLAGRRRWRHVVYRPAIVAERRIRVKEAPCALVAAAPFTNLTDTGPHSTVATLNLAHRSLRVFPLLGGPRLARRTPCVSLELQTAMELC